MKIENIDIGPLDADDDLNLHKYFIPFGDFSKFQDGNKFIMVGIKGTGKSAVKKFLATERRNNKQLVIEFDDRNSLPLYDVENFNPTDIKNKLTLFIIGFIVNFLINLDDISEDNKKKLKKLESPYFERVISKIKVVDYVEFSLKDLFTKSDNKKYDIVDQTTIDCITDVLEGKDLWVLLDDLHKVFPIEEKEKLIRFIEGLIYLASDINKRLFNNSVNVIVFVRAEIYEDLLLIAEELDKELSYIWHVKWSHKELINLLSKRILWAIGNETDVEGWKIWNELFIGETEEEIEVIQKYLVSKVVNGPRDLLLIVNGAKNIAVKELSNKIGINHIEEYEYDYGQEKLNQINRNFQRIYPGIKAIIESSFRKANSSYTRDKFEEILNEIINKNQEVAWVRKCTSFRFMQILYNIGFIGYQDSNKNDFIFYIEQPNLERLRTDHQIKIHNAFHKYLELDEKQ